MARGYAGRAVARGRGWREHKKDLGKFNTEQRIRNEQNRNRFNWDRSSSQNNEDGSIKFGLLLLLHLYFEDDGEVSYMEKASIRNIIKNNKEKFNHAEVVEFETYLSSYVTKQTLMNYINEYQLTTQVVQQAKEMIEDITRKPLYMEYLDTFMAYYEQQKS